LKNTFKSTKLQNYIFIYFKHLAYILLLILKNKFQSTKLQNHISVYFNALSYLLPLTFENKLHSTKNRQIHISVYFNLQTPREYMKKSPLTC